MSAKNFLIRAVRKIISLTKERIMIPIPTPINTNELLAGKIALITGGSGGIGMGIARAFLNSGAKVIIASTNKAKLERCMKDLGEREGGYDL